MTQEFQNDPYQRHFARERGVDDAHMTDQSLLDGVSAHNEHALAALFDRYGTMVYSVAFRVLRDPREAEDLMQEIFLQTWTSPRDWGSNHGPLGAWLAVVTRNRAIDTLRKRKHTDPVEEVSLASPVNFASAMERDALLGKVRQELRTLPEEQQSSLEMAFFEGLTHAEIAARTGDPLGTVKTRIRSALGHLRKALQG